MFGSRNPRPDASRKPVPSQPSNPYGRVPSENPDWHSQQPGRPAQGIQGSHRDYNSEKSNYNGPPTGQGQRWQLRPAKAPSNEYIFGNLVAVSPADFPAQQDGQDFYVMLNDSHVLTARPFRGFPPGQISLSDPQRVWASISLMDVVSVTTYDPFQERGNHYLGSVDVEIGFAGKRSSDAPLDQDELAQHFIRSFENQIFAPNQRVIMDYRSLPLLIVFKTVQLLDLTMSKSNASSAPTSSMASDRGILTRQTTMNFFKDAKSPINIRASNRRPAANAILQPNFKFEDMGIGGLDKEFATIFRRAFASRIFPPGLIEKMGIQHAKGILLYGPPGTGKTLIARKIGKMLNAREPKVINGPEVLNKFVGQSEENIRKLFADAEKEYKEKGDESGLHIIIFDELDAVCKQRGSGAGGGTGVGDSVVNQLLSKLDGVDQLNNILLIGMTNRKDMIDDALMRPGRLEIHMEISLPDEEGRVRILGIHTTKLRESGMLSPDVDLDEIARRAKNFSGAELAGLIRAATSFALTRHTKVGAVAAVEDNLETVRVTMADFDQAFGEVQPAFGVSEKEIEGLISGGIIPYSPSIENILLEGQLFVKQVEHPDQEDSLPIFSAILHGPPGSGKTALAARIALDSKFPLIKLISPDDMVDLNEPMKIEHMRRIFDDAYKSPRSLVLVDDIESIIDWTPIGPRFSNSVFQALKKLLKKRPPHNRRLLILATTSEKSVLQQLNLFSVFNYKIAVPNVTSYDEVGFLLQRSQAFDTNRAIQELQTMTDGRRLSVGVQQILLAIETAKKDSRREERFASFIAQSMAETAGGGGGGMDA